MSMVESMPRTPNRRLNTEKNKTPGPLTGVGICPLYSASALIQPQCLPPLLILLSVSVFVDEPTKAMCVGLY